MFINQIIYVRKKPELKTYNYDEIRSKLESNNSSINAALKALFKSELENKSGIKSEYDRTSLDRFYVLSVEDDKFCMKPISMAINMPVNKYDSIEEVNEEFISLLDVMNKGKYVGKEFKRTKPLDAISIGIEPEEYNPIVLYKYDDIMLGLFDRDCENHSYGLISRIYTDDNNWTLKDKVYSDYDDKQTVFNTVLCKINDDLNSEKIF